MDHHTISEMGMGHRAMGANGAVFSDPDMFADDSVRADQGARSDCSRWSDDRERIDGYVTLQLCRGMHGRAGRDTFIAEHRGRTKRAAINFTHDLDEGVIRLAHAQHRHTAWAWLAKRSLVSTAPAPVAASA